MVFLAYKYVADAESGRKLERKPQSIELDQRISDYSGRKSIDVPEFTGKLFECRDMMFL